jgi:predicted metal-dependent RNase
VAVVHGEEEAALSLVSAVEDRFGWSAMAPEKDDVLVL